MAKTSSSLSTIDHHMKHLIPISMILAGAYLLGLPFQLRAEWLRAIAQIPDGATFHTGPDILPPMLLVLSLMFCGLVLVGVGIRLAFVAYKQQP
jgi:hypothetical protein